MSSKLKSNEEIQKMIDKVYNGEYILIGDYKGSQKPSEVLHTKCNKVINKYIPILLRKEQLCKCEEIKKEFNKNKEYISHITNNEYELIEYYSTNKATFKHVKCGRVYQNNYVRFTEGNQRCKECQGLGTKTHNEFILELNELTNSRFEVLDKYVNAHTELRFKDLECGEIFKRTPNKQLGRKTCPKCIRKRRESIGEILCKNFLIEKDIEFIQEYKVIKNELLYYYDFAIFNNNELICFIEYDGRQHYEPVNHFGGEETYNEQVKRDKIKDKIAIDDFNVKIIRVPYYLTEHQIKDYLESSLAGISNF